MKVNEEYRPTLANQGSLIYVCFVFLYKLDGVSWLVTDPPRAKSMSLKDPLICKAPTSHRHYFETNPDISKMLVI